MSELISASSRFTSSWRQTLWLWRHMLKTWKCNWALKSTSTSLILRKEAEPLRRERNFHLMKRGRFSQEASTQDRSSLMISSMELGREPTILTSSLLASKTHSITSQMPLLMPDAMWIWTMLASIWTRDTISTNQWVRFRVAKWGENPKQDQGVVHPWRDDLH